MYVMFTWFVIQIEFYMVFEILMDIKDLLPVINWQVEMISVKRSINRQKMVEY